MMNIGEASRSSGLPAKTIRYYEEIGLILPDRAGNGYRDYSQTHLHKLQFLQRSRGLGFSIDECRQLLALYEDKGRASADVKAMTQSKITAIETKINELESLRQTLMHLAENCKGNSRPECPILNDLAREGSFPKNR